MLLRKEGKGYASMFARYLKKPETRPTTNNLAIGADLSEIASLSGRGAIPGRNQTATNKF